MSCENCVCPKCRRDAVARLVWLVGQVRAAQLLGVSQSSISRHLNRKSELAPSYRSLAAATLRVVAGTHARSEPGNG